MDAGNHASDLFDSTISVNNTSLEAFKVGSRFHMAHAEPAKIQDRQSPAKNEKCISRKAQPLEQRICAIRKKLQRSRVEISHADRVIELQDAQRK